MKNLACCSLFLLFFCISKGQTPRLVSLCDSLLKPGKYKVIANMKDGNVVIYTDSSGIEIKKNDNKITFTASEKLSLFNFLSIDLKDHTVYFDNIKVTSELDIDGKFYAPDLKGIESHMAKEINSKHKTEITDFAFSIGINKGEKKPTMCLLYVKPSKQQRLLRPEILSITIL